ncbi:DUF1684 domain-containing protein [Streptomyces sp. NPDC054796]
MSTEASRAAAATEADTEGSREWERWREKRVRVAAAPYGPLSVTGTHWIAEAEHGRIAGLPGEWAETGDGGGVLLEATVADGLAVDGELLAGEVLLGEDAGPPEESRVGYGARRLVLLRREGLWAVRVFDADAPARRAFTGIDAFPYDPEWVRKGTFLPYGEGERSVRVGNADGRERGLGLAGELSFTAPDGSGHTLQVSRVEGGALWAVLADGTSARTPDGPSDVTGRPSSYRFRFLRTEAPGADGSVRVDLNRITLPPCAFNDNFLCPFPPPGNTLPFDLTAGERRLSGS